jgi:shikimate kinase
MTPLAVFVGPMASGKTKVGRRVARDLGVGFVDTDRTIVAEHGPIAEIFARDGEPRFRELERAAVVSALQTDGVVSLGGGAVLDPATRADLATQRVVLLTVTPQVVARRLALQAGKRPLVADGVAQWERIFAERRPLYDEVATATFDTSVGDFDSIAREVAAWLTT